MHFRFDQKPLTEAEAKSEMEAWYLSRRSPQKSILEWVAMFLEKHECQSFTENSSCAQQITIVKVIS